ncbi:MAG: ribonuclease P protein component [Planctomycetes bacterium]|nr:ribonuclease P protein component [Planctomycetota bacterium]MBI3833611.1 ribonuclease P protein component [Planctomycetota bacterium]
MHVPRDPSTKPDQRFRPQERLKSDRDFDRVYKLRFRASDHALTVYVAENELPWSRLGISVSKRVGGAVQRNYVKRRIREAFRRNKSHLPGGLDIVCVANAKATDRGIVIADSLETLVKKATARFLPQRLPDNRTT